MYELKARDFLTGLAAANHLGKLSTRDKPQIFGAFITLGETVSFYGTDQYIASRLTTTPVIKPENPEQKEIFLPIEIAKQVIAVGGADWKKKTVIDVSTVWIEMSDKTMTFQFIQYQDRTLVYEIRRSPKLEVPYEHATVDVRKLFETPNLSPEENTEDVYRVTSMVLENTIGCLKSAAKFHTKKYLAKILSTRTGNALRIHTNMSLELIAMGCKFNDSKLKGEK